MQNKCKVSCADNCKLTLPHSVSASQWVSHEGTRASPPLLLPPRCGCLVNCMPQLGTIDKNKFCCSAAKSYPTLCDSLDCSMPGFPVPHHLPDFAQDHVHWVGDATQPSHPLLSSSSAFNLSQHLGLFQGVSCSHQVVRYWSFNFSISPSKEYSGLISWFDPLDFHGTLKSLLQHHSLFANKKVFKSFQVS